METEYERGATPERLIQASPLLWDNAFGCLPLLEDAMIANPGYQFFHRERDGFCFGGPLKKVQWICTIMVTQVQIMLYPNEYMQRFEDTTGGPSYAGIKEKLMHLDYLFTKFLLVSKNVLANKLGMYLDNEESLAEKVVEATTVFAESWFPSQGPLIPPAELCVELNNELPFTHGVFSREERTIFGFPSGGSYNTDC